MPSDFRRRVQTREDKRVCVVARRYGDLVGHIVDRVLEAQRVVVFNRNSCRLKRRGNSTEIVGVIGAESDLTDTSIWRLFEDKLNAAIACRQLPWRFLGKTELSVPLAGVVHLGDADAKGCQSMQ